MMRVPVWLGLVFVAYAYGQAQVPQAAEVPAPRPVELTAPVQDKNFFVLSLMEHNAAAAEVLSHDNVFKQVFEQKQTAISTAARECQSGVACFVDAVRWKDDEITAIAARLRGLVGSHPAVRTLAERPLRESGMYIRRDHGDSAALLAESWMEAARGINNILDVYGTGKKPRYPEIDSISFDPAAPGYRQMAHTAAYLLAEQGAEMHLFFQPSLRFALYLLDINKRDEAGRHEPMEQRENAAAVKQIPSFDWARYPYTVIVVPGAGSDRTTWSLSGAGKQRVEIAARRYRQGKAPLILVSGGYVHPKQTPYAEAVEMKRSLMADFGVPESAILIDPHARHTTTNLRNAARLMYRYGVPFERKALITTDSYQSAYIESEVFVKRNAAELGYQPHKLLLRTSPFDLEFLPMIESLQSDPIDPLDP